MPESFVPDQLLHLISDLAARTIHLQTLPLNKTPERFENDRQRIVSALSFHFGKRDIEVRVRLPLQHPAEGCYQVTHYLSVVPGSCVTPAFNLLFHATSSPLTHLDQALLPSDFVEGSQYDLQPTVPTLLFVSHDRSS